MHIVAFDNGRRVRALTLTDAICIAVEGLADPVIDEGPDRTLVWSSEEEAENDDGSRAHAVITQAR